MKFSLAIQRETLIFSTCCPIWYMWDADPNPSHNHCQQSQFQSIRNNFDLVISSVYCIIARGSDIKGWGSKCTYEFYEAFPKEVLFGSQTIFKHGGAAQRARYLSGFCFVVPMIWARCASRRYIKNNNVTQRVSSQLMYWFDLQSRMGGHWKSLEKVFLPWSI